VWEASEEEKMNGEKEVTYVLGTTTEKQKKMVNGIYHRLNTHDTCDAAMRQSAAAC
jgi:hypothetical protein